MKPLEKNEIFHNLSGFLKLRGIEIKDGSYAQGIQKSCELLTRAINLGQESLERAKDEVDKGMEHMRKVIHEKTAPKPPPTPAAAPPKPEAKAKPVQTTGPKPKPAKAKPRAGKAGKSKSVKSRR